MNIQQKLTRTFFITFTLLMGLGAHYFQHNQGGSGLELPQNNVVWIFFSTLIGLGLWQITTQKKIYYSRFTLYFFAAFVLFSIPVFYPNNELAIQSYPRLLGLIAGFLLFFTMQQFQFTRSELQRLLLLIVLAGFLQATYSLVQDYLLPIDNIFGYNVGTNRPYGIFQQPNVLASFMATTLILAGYLLQQIKNKKLQSFLLLTALLNMWVITITMSRTSYLGSLLALLLFIPWAWRCNKRRLAFFIIAISLGIGFAMLKGDALAARNIDNLKEGGARLDIYHHSWQMIKQKPFLGYGYGSFEKSYLISQAEYVKNGKLTFLPQQLTHPHNEFLLWSIEGGILPVIAILCLVICFLRRLCAFPASLAMALIALVLPIIIHTQTEYPLYHSALHWLVLIVLVFYVDHESQRTQRKNFNLTFALRIFALLIPIVATLFMLTNLLTIAKITKYERSKTPNIHLLTAIINPLVFENRLNFHLNDFRLSVALQLNNQDEIKKVIEWIEKTVKTTPKPPFYAILFRAYSNINQPEKAAQVLDYARYIYPTDVQLANIDKEFKDKKLKMKIQR